MSNPVQISLEGEAVTLHALHRPRGHHKVKRIYDDSGGLRQCGKCLDRKQLSEFYIRAGRWPHRICKQCTRIGLSNYRSTPKGRQHLGNINKKYRHTEKGKQSRHKYYEGAKFRGIVFARNREVKERVIRKYGGMCACCGETIRLFLGLDHVKNNGKKERLTLSQQRLYWQLDKLPPQREYQVLCHSCNIGKYLNGGRCPHETVLRLVIANG